MKGNRNQSILFLFSIFCAAGILLLDGSLAYAQEAMSLGRRLWNNVMLFFNFGILVFVFMKYARKPLVNLLKNMCRKIEESLNTAGHQLREAQALLDAEKAKLGAIEEHLQKIQERILQIAQTEKDAIIEHGRLSAERMIENAGSYANYRISMAQKTLSDELVEMAVSIAQEKLAKGLSEQDDDRLIESFLTGLETSRKHYRMALG